MYIYIYFTPKIGFVLEVKDTAVRQKISLCGLEFRLKKTFADSRHTWGISSPNNYHSFPGKKQNFGGQRVKDD
jgi:hypothetical protein